MVMVMVIVMVVMEMEIMNESFTAMPRISTFWRHSFILVMFGFFFFKCRLTGSSCKY